MGDAAGRVRAFVVRVAEQQRAFGLMLEDRWVAVSHAGAAAFPMWHTREAAEDCAVDAWIEAVAVEMSLDASHADPLPGADEQATLIAVFPVPGEPGLVMTAGELIAALRTELASY